MAADLHRNPRNTRLRPMPTPQKKSLPIGQILILVVLVGIIAWRFWPRKTELPEMRYRCDSCGAVLFRQPPSKIAEQPIPEGAGPEEVEALLQQEFMDQHSAGACPQCSAGTLREAPLYKCTTCSQVFEGTLAMLRQDTIRCPKCGKMIIERLMTKEDPPADAILIDPTKTRKRN